MSLDKQVRTLFTAHGVELAKDDIWQVQSATVIRHKALERLGAAAGVIWHEPTIVRAEKEEAVILVRGTLGERMEWSVGEALIGANYRVSGKQAAYVYAMAEKRGKDRVILKLVGLHGLYSEEEADEFRQQAPAREVPQPADVPPAKAPAAEPTAFERYATRMGQAQSLDELNDIAAEDGIAKLTPVEAGELRRTYKFVAEKLKRFPGRAA